MGASPARVCNNLGSRGATLARVHEQADHAAYRVPSRYDLLRPGRIARADRQHGRGYKAPEPRQEDAARPGDACPIPRCENGLGRGG